MRGGSGGQQPAESDSRVATLANRGHPKLIQVDGRELARLHGPSASATIDLVLSILGRGARVSHAEGSSDQVRKAAEWQPGHVPQVAT